MSQQGRMVCGRSGCGKPGRLYGGLVLCGECAARCARILETALEGATIEEIMAGLHDFEVQEKFKRARKRVFL